MGAFWHFLRGRRGAALLLVLMTLAVRLIVPAGFMPAPTESGFAIVLCPAAGAVPLAMTGMHHPHGHDAPAKADSACPFAGLSLPGLGGADAVQIAALVAVILASGMRPAAMRPRERIAHLRPPLRGPPALV